MTPHINDAGLSSLESRQDDIIRRIDAGGRLEVARELYNTAWNLKMAAVRRQHPEWPDEEVFAKVRRVFLTGYAGA